MRRRLSSAASAATVKTLKHQKWSVKQVTKSNFSETLDEIRVRIDSSEFVAVSLENTGAYAAAWHRVSAFDTPQTAYLKAKHAAERYQILQFAVCPFSVCSSKLTAHTYNFHLFPRDELKLGMPSYSFSCQPARLAAMARAGFDFNTCIYEGISYLSRAQESVAKFGSGNPIQADSVIESSSPASVADTIFIGRIRSRVKHWKQACTDSSSKTHEALLTSLRKLVLGSEEYGSRPCMTIDVCSEHQAQLILEMSAEFPDLVPLLIPSKGGGTQAVRVVLTSSKEDKDLLKKELWDLEVEQNRRVRGFREVIDLISASQKPVVSQNSLNDLTLIHSKFLSPLPSNLDAFITSLGSAFPNVVDVYQLMRKVSPLKKFTNVAAAMSYLNDRFFAPLDVEVANQVKVDEGQIHGHNVLMICQLFAKLCAILKVDPATIQFNDKLQASVFDEYADILNSNPSLSEESVVEDVSIWTNNTRKVSSENLVFLWGLGKKMTAGTLKNLLIGSHGVFSEEFNVKFVDKSCAIVVLWNPGLSQTFLNAINGEEQLSGPLKQMVEEGLRATGYETYKRACRLGFWEADLADSLDRALESADSDPDSETKPSEIYWLSESIINFDEL